MIRLGGGIVVAGLILAFATILAGEQIFTSQLQRVLSEVLNSTVEVDTARLRPFPLQADVTLLRVGNVDAPLIIARDLKVQLDWRSLVRGELRPTLVSVGQLTVDASGSAVSSQSNIEDYRYLEQWLPAYGHIQDLKLVLEDTRVWRLQELQWQHDSGIGTDISWIENSSGRDLLVSASFQSLSQLFALDSMRLSLELSAVDSNQVAISSEWRLLPKAAGYSLEGSIDAGATELTITATNSQGWSLPEVSATRVQSLNVTELRQLVSGLVSPSSQWDMEQFLATELPEIFIPVHQGTITVATLQIADETLLDNSLVFTTSAAGISITKIRSTGPRGELLGTANLLHDESGWAVQLRGEVRALTESAGIASQFAQNKWVWSDGNIDLAANGSSWGGLLNATRGEILLVGLHQGDTQTPVKLTASFDSSAAELGLTRLELELGKSIVTGSIGLTGGYQRTFTGRIKSTNLDLGFLFAEQQETFESGIVLPESLLPVPEIDLDIEIRVNTLHTSSVSLQNVQVSLHRANHHGVLELQATGPADGHLQLSVSNKNLLTAGEELAVHLELSAVDFPGLFGQEPDRLRSRTSGKLKFSGKGNNLVEVFETMSGPADLSAMLDLAGQSSAGPVVPEQFHIAGISTLVIEDRRLLGINIAELELDSLHQEVSGSIALVAGRKPWLEAKLEAPRLDVDAISRWFPSDSPSNDLRQQLQRWSPAKISLQVGSLSWLNTPVSDVSLELLLGEGESVLETLNFNSSAGRVKGHAALEWQGNVARFNAQGTIDSFQLDSFLAQDNGGEPIHLLGTYDLQSKGQGLEELLQNVSGKLNVKGPVAGSGPSEVNRRRLDMTFRREPGFLEAKIVSLEREDSDLSANIVYRDSGSPKWEVDIAGGTLSLLPWEIGEIPAYPPLESGADNQGGVFANAARASSSLMHTILSAPVGYLGANRIRTPGQRVFNASPLALDGLAAQDWVVRGHLDSVISSEVRLQDVSFNGRLSHGKLDVDIQSSNVNGGNVDFQLGYDTASTEKNLSLNAHFQDFHRDITQADFARTGSLVLNSRGQSEAELMANLNGTAYLELGQGPFDHGGLSFLTNDAVAAVVRRLIPDTGQSAPELECAVTLLQIKDGLAITPYGYVARTHKANLMGRMEVDLATEKLRMEFGSRSHQGVGIAVGDVFSNTVKLQGTLSQPRVVPQTLGILWRGWAAFMTAGVSILGETALKRVLVSSTPCADARELMRKDMCGSVPLPGHARFVCAS